MPCYIKAMVTQMKHVGCFVEEELPCQKVHTISEDQFVVVVTKGETKLIAGHSL